MQQKKTIISAITASLMLCSMLTCIPAGAEELTQGDLKYENRGDYIAITGCNSGTEAVDIPAEIDGLPVTWIDNLAFRSANKTLTEVTLPDTLEYIADYAFAGCTKLTQITLPENVVVLGKEVFGICTGLEAFYVDEDNQNFTSVDGVLFSKDMTVLHCYPEGKQDAAYIIPEQTQEIEKVRNAHLTSVAVSADMKQFHNEFFCECPALTEYQVDPGNTMLDSVDGVVYSEDGSVLLAYPAGKTGEAYAVPAGVTEIGEYAFAANKSLCSITLPDDLKTIGRWAFSDCVGLERIVVPDQVETLGHRAFENCEGLVSLTLSKSLREIGSYAFFSCTGLTELTVPDGVTQLEDGLFMKCTGLETVNLPNKLTYIDAFAFAECTAMESIHLPVSLTEINNSAFQSCIALKDVYFAGSESAWGAVKIRKFQNDKLLNAAMHFGGEAPDTCKAGDLDQDGRINASDAAALLIAAAAAGTGAETGLTDAQLAAADLNADGTLDAKDAALILQYAAYTGTGGTDSIQDFLANLN